MDLKQELINQALRLMQDPRVLKAMQNPAVMQGIVTAMQLRARMQENLETQARSLAKRLNLATEAELRELRRTIARLEDELDRQQQQARGRSMTESKRDSGHAA